MDGILAEKHSNYTSAWMEFSVVVCNEQSCRYKTCGMADDAN